MKVSRKSSLALFALTTTMLLAGCTGGNTGYKTKYYNVTGDYLTGKKAKSVYKALLGSSIKTLNYLKDQGAQNSRHVANFIDGLVMNDEYTVLRKQLATKATKNDSNTEFTFTLREGVKWYTYDGKPFKVGGVEQEVVAEDFVTSAEVILNYNNSSELAYLLRIFLEGGHEYYAYTMMKSLMTKMRTASHYPLSGKVKEDGSAYGIADLLAGDVTPDCRFNYSSIKNAEPDVVAMQLTNLISFESGLDVDECRVEGNQLDAINRFERSGVKALSKYKLEYRLSSSMNFFPTVLTYCPFLPVNKEFYNQKKADFGKTNADILYCGPYLLSKFQGSDIVYSANENYYDKDKVHIDRVEYKVVEDNVSDDYTRKQFEAGNIDGFSISKKDEVGWNDYIVGHEGDEGYPGTIREPANGLVNSRELDEVDSVYSFNFNLNRATDVYNKATGDSYLTADEIAISNAVLHIKEVRAMIMKGLELERYGDIYVDYRGAESRSQYAMNTFVPRGFVRDENGKDYVDYYYDYVAEKENISVKEAAANWAQQQYAGVQYPDTLEGYQAFKHDYVDPAMNAIEKYNEAVEAGTLYDDNGELITKKITYPIKLEVLGSQGVDTSYKKYESSLYYNLCEKINGVRITNKAKYTSYDLPIAEGGNYPYFIISVNDKITSSDTAETVTYGGYYTMGIAMGWGPDYADPLTYYNCYTNKGDMNDFTGHNGDTLTYYVDEATGKIASKKISGEYTEKVNAAKAITEDTSRRYAAFAECEYMLHNDMCLWRPVHMDTQGYTASVSRAAGYENPNSSYGLAAYRLTGMWVLTEVPTAKERQACRALQEERKIVETRKGLIQIFD